MECPHCNSEFARSYSVRVSFYESMPQTEWACGTSENAKGIRQSITCKSNQITSLQAENEALRGVVDRLIPQTYGEAIRIYPWIRCENYEWDNRTTPENAEWFAEAIANRNRAAAQAAANDENPQ